MQLRISKSIDFRNLEIDFKNPKVLETI